MPELPEVETVMRGLVSCLLGRTIMAAAVNRADLRWPLPAGLAARLTGARVQGFRRRGKYILMRLSGGDSLLLHLGMSGRMAIAAHGPHMPVAHEHLVMTTSAGMRVALIDPRRFGSLDLVPTAAEDNHRLLACLGPEPLEPGFDARSLSAALAGKRTPIKAGLAIYMCAKRCSAPAFRPVASPPAWRARARAGW
jgi:formamidopyrimidine-DNA glycosylase